VVIEGVVVVVTADETVGAGSNERLEGKQLNEDLALVCAIFQADA
jgi:hypothetical protein